MAELAALWPAAVGDQIARNAWPARIGRDGKLHVATSSAAWAFELTNLGGTVLQRLREALGEGAPKALAFAPGRVPEPSHEALRSDVPAPAAAGAAERARAGELTAEITSEELRQHVAAALAAALARAAADRRF